MESSPEFQQLITFMHPLEALKCNIRTWCGDGETLIVSSSALNTLQEREKAMVNEMIAKLTTVCWDKCITGTPGSKFSSSESSCLTNCAQRYMDMSIIIMKRFQNMQ